MNDSKEIPRPHTEYPTYFSPADYFLGIARHALASENDVQVSLPQIGEVTFSPSRGAYHAAVSDMRAFCQAHASLFRITVLKQADMAPRDDTQLTGHTNDLLWQAAFHASQGRLVESYANGNPVRILDVVKFRRWPNLTRLPMTRNTMRICALLTRHPSSLLLVSRKLGIEQEEVFQVCSAACGAGIAHVACGQTAGSAPDHPDGPNVSQKRHGLLDSLFNKITRL